MNVSPVAKSPHAKRFGECVGLYRDYIGIVEGFYKDLYRCKGTKSLNI